MVKIIFFGTANISKSFLEELFKNKHEILCITKPDKISSRGQKLSPPAVKVFSQDNNIELLQFEKFDAQIIEKIKAFNADIGIAVSYGKIIPESVFNLPKFKTFNIHFSLLPKYRGAAPVQYAVLNGESVTGVSSFYIQKSLDTGDILIQREMPIDIKDTSETVFNKLIPLGIKVMNETISNFENGQTQGTPQSGEPSFAPTFKKEDGFIDWNKTALEIYNKIRGLHPWPGTFSIITKGKLANKRLKILEADMIDDNKENEQIGFIGSIEKNVGFVVHCKKGKLLVKTVQPENKSPMTAWAFMQGGQFGIGDSL